MRTPQTLARSKQRESYRRKQFRAEFVGPPKRRGKPTGVTIKAVVGTSMADGSQYRYSPVAHAAQDGFSPRLIADCANGQRKFHAGFFWRWDEING